MNDKVPVSIYNNDKNKEILVFLIDFLFNEYVYISFFCQAVGPLSYQTLFWPPPVLPFFGQLAP